jgi:hypothetical protein
MRYDALQHAIILRDRLPAMNDRTVDPAVTARRAQAPAYRNPDAV